MSQQDHTHQSQSRGSDASRRRRRRKNPVLAALSYVLLVIAVSLILACVAWVAAGDVLALNKEPLTATIVISEDDSFGEVTDQLKEQGIIEYKFLFNLFATFTHAKNDIVAGSYALNTDMDYRAILSNIGSHSTARVEISVTIPEGYTVQQVFALLEEKGVSTVEKLNDMAATHDYKFSFLEGIPLGSAQRLEGYLYPDTYNFYLNQDPLHVINKMLQGFDARVTDEMRTEVAQGD